MCATVSVVSVQRPTCAPRRAAACAASQPACPAPITITSKSVRMADARLKAALLYTFNRRARRGRRENLISAIFARSAACISLAYTKAREDVREKIFGRAAAADFFE